ncbi:MAG TPA: SpoIVB peptidase [Symbiobacteriaceae bacterium]|nr:SpoIVB peptidase [Symbiobacteriaceae bacterium]
MPMKDVVRLRQLLGLLLVTLLLAFASTPGFRQTVNLPTELRWTEGEVPAAVTNLPLRPVARPQGARAPWTAALPGQVGRYTLDLRLFGLIPLRRMAVEVVPTVKVIPGGHSIGVMLRSKGVLVVGHMTVRTADGELQPGRTAGLELGDAILTIAGQEVRSEVHAKELLETLGKGGGPVTLEVKRRGRILTKELRLAREEGSQKWRAGLQLRDNAAGVGTLTFYEPVSGKYGALGHVIADAETAQPIEVRDGHIVRTSITAIHKGRRAMPGEKVGGPEEPDNWLGSIDKNSRFGIFGSMNRPLRNPFYREAIPVAMSSQVKEGPAEILTVLQGERLERFGVEIQRVMSTPTADGKNMIVKVTDQRLLSVTGGIVQGMSGSPILQDGRIVGAVTHVFVNDPTRGYGVSIEWMLQEAGVYAKQGAGLSTGGPAPFAVYHRAVPSQEMQVVRRPCTIPITCGAPGVAAA